MRDKGVMKLYRTSRKLYLNKIPTIPKIIKNFIRVVYAATIPYTVEIGKNTKFPHGAQGVVLNDNCIIGNDCIISAGVIIGGKSGTKSVPIIGNNVVVGANSTIIGNVKIGDGAIIGAGSVVVKNVAANTVVVGNPAKPISKK